MNYPFTHNAQNVIYATASADKYPDAIPAPLDALPYPKRPTSISDDQLTILTKQGFTKGLANAAGANCEDFPVRFWIIDNSGSMNKADGHRIIETSAKDDVRIVDCTRWEEIKECVNYHANLAALLLLPTVFKFLNNPGARAGAQQFSVAEYSLQNVQDEQYSARTTMSKTSPEGFTPLRERVIELHDAILPMAHILKSTGQKAVVTIATDGKPTDESGYSTDFVTDMFVQALRQLMELPVWVVIRLCTDDDDVVSFYNTLDDDLELSIEVLDDFFGEAMEVYETNPWLNYGLPLHRMRESGFNERAFDFIDQRALTKTELRQFCICLFGQEKFDGVADPSVDWKGFVSDIERFNRQESNTYNPIKKKVLPWVDTHVLEKEYGDEPDCCVVM